MVVEQNLRINLAVLYLGGVKGMGFTGEASNSRPSLVPIKPVRMVRLLVTALPHQCITLHHYKLYA